ncbi:MAG: phosphotransferase [Pseudohongiella sp.]|nr:phosphotransferase [Pseudohongiella sp.]MDP2128531.1 phosphotransferase [Pseudohongiella sp.]
MSRQQQSTDGDSGTSETNTDIRHQQLQQWARVALQQLLGSDPGPVNASALGGDASFRRYFRHHAGSALSLEGFDHPVKSLMLVDAPPERENNPAFLLTASEFRAAGLQTPTILAHDLEQGFMLLEDFGDQLYLPCLQAAQDAGDMARVDVLYTQAMNALLALQSDRSVSQLPPYDQTRLHNELSLFDEWFCGRMLGIELDADETRLLANTWQFLEQAALGQTQVRVHRDYHSRNLMVRQHADGSHPENQPPGVIDFQDAVTGAVTYDLVSLLRDCYIVWPAEDVSRWLRQYFEQAQARDIVPASLSWEAFRRDFDLMGIQRHIKVLGIFCRLALRDNKPRYLLDLPVVMDYVVTVGERHPELKAFISWFRRGPMIDMYGVLTASGPLVSSADLAYEHDAEEGH